MRDRRDTDTILSIKNVTFTYPGGEGPSLRNVTLPVARGDFLAVTGNNGSGKSTLCKVINGLIPHFLAGDFEGAVMIDGLDAASQDIDEVSKRIGFVYQDFENQIICPTVLEDASFGCLNYGLPRHLERGREALRLVGLAQKEKEYVWQLSGGEKHLLALAGVIAMNPDVYILDEPAAQLDFTHARQIYGILRDLNEKDGKTILVVEHHAEFIAQYGKELLLMENGEILWKRPVKEALVLTEELVKRNVFPPQVTQAARRLQISGSLSAGCILPTTVEEGKAVFSPLWPPEETRVADAQVCLPRREGAAAIGGESPHVRFVEIEAGYRGLKAEDKKIFHGMSLALYRGRKTALVGRNGSGKSTLLKLLAGMLRPTAGDILVDGQSILGMPIETLAQTVSLVFQNPEEMFITDSVKHDLEYALKARGTTDYERRVETLLRQFDLEALCRQDGRLLSGGQQRRASIAIGVALNPPILLLDEPTSNLDMASRNSVIHTLKRLEGVVETIVVATHDMRLVCEWAERVIILAEGALLAEADRDGLFSDPGIMEQAGLYPPEIYRMGQALEPPRDCYTVDAFVELWGKEKGNEILRGL